MRIRFITSNQGKLAEAQTRLAPLGYDVQPYKAKIEEIQADTLEAVAHHKAATLIGVAPAPCFLEDAGLFVDHLNGFPGVYSHHAFQTLGCQGILDLLRGQTGEARGATFRAVIAYVDKRERIHLLPGQAAGTITTRPRGTHGFGFDPIFMPQGSRKTFAELSAHEKGNVSHRGRALDALVQFLGRDANKKV